jgi:hypothetical protein
MASALSRRIVGGVRQTLVPRVCLSLLIPFLLIGGDEFTNVLRHKESFIVVKMTNLAEKLPFHEGQPDKVYKRLHKQRKGDHPDQLTLF